MSIGLVRARDRVDRGPDPPRRAEEPRPWTMCGVAPDGASGVSPDGQPVDAVLASVAAYSESAEEYEAAHASKMADRVRRFAGSLEAPARILDAGCGPGRDLARFVAWGHDALGVELNPVFAAMAASRAPTRQADLRRLREIFPPGSFDGIWASASLVHLAEEEARDVLVQFATLLRPGGRLYVCVNTVGRTGWLDEADGRRWYQIWEAGTFEHAVADCGFTIDRVDSGPFVEVWASRRRAASVGTERLSEPGR